MLSGKLSEGDIDISAQIGDINSQLEFPKGVPEEKWKE